LILKSWSNLKLEIFSSTPSSAIEGTRSRCSVSCRGISLASGDIEKIKIGVASLEPQADFPPNSKTEGEIGINWVPLITKIK
jgi:hypothetical protein